MITVFASLAVAFPTDVPGLDEAVAVCAGRDGQACAAVRQGPNLEGTPRGLVLRRVVSLRSLGIPDAYTIERLILDDQGVRVVAGHDLEDQPPRSALVTFDPATAADVRWSWLGTDSARVLDVRDGRVLWRWDDHLMFGRHAIRTSARVGGGRWTDRRVVGWSRDGLVNWRPGASPKLIDTPVDDAAISPDGRLVATVDPAAILHVFDVVDGRQVYEQSVPKAKGGVRHLAFTTHRHVLLCGDQVAWFGVVDELRTGASSPAIDTPPLHSACRELRDVASDGQFVWLSRGDDLVRVDGATLDPSEGSWRIPNRRVAVYESWLAVATGSVVWVFGPEGGEGHFRSKAPSAMRVPRPSRMKAALSRSRTIEALMVPSRGPLTLQIRYSDGEVRPASFVPDSRCRLCPSHARLVVPREAVPQEEWRTRLQAWPIGQRSSGEVLVPGIDGYAWPWSVADGPTRIEAVDNQTLEIHWAEVDVMPWTVHDLVLTGRSRPVRLTVVDTTGSPYADVEVARDHEGSDMAPPKTDRAGQVERWLPVGPQELFVAGMAEPTHIEVPKGKGFVELRIVVDRGS